MNPTMVMYVEMETDSGVSKGRGREHFLCDMSTDDNNE